MTSTQPGRYDAVYPRIDAFAGNDDVTLAPHPSPSDYMIIQPLSYAEETSSSSVTTQRTSTAVLISDDNENEDDSDDDVFVKMTSLLTEKRHDLHPHQRRRR